MAKHTKKRQMHVECAHCGTRFVTGSPIKVYCSDDCRVLAKMAAFADPEACWNWPGSVNPKTGYGQFSSWVDGKRVLVTAHRAAYQAANGPIPPGLYVCHTCDNRACFNPRHLFLGSQSENMADMKSKGRHSIVPRKMPRGPNHHFWGGSHPSLRRGSSHHAAKITEVDVLAIRASSKTVAALAKEYGVSGSTLSSIRTRKTWAHVK